MVIGVDVLWREKQKQPTTIKCLLNCTLSVNCAVLLRINYKSVSVYTYLIYCAPSVLSFHWNQVETLGILARWSAHSCTHTLHNRNMKMRLCVPFFMRNEHSAQWNRTQTARNVPHKWNGTVHISVLFVQYCWFFMMFACFLSFLFFLLCARDKFMDNVWCFSEMNIFVRCLLSDE